MLTILCVVGGLWLGGSLLLVLALGVAARRATPPMETVVELQEAA